MADRACRDLRYQPRPVHGQRKANHIQVVYANSAADADKAMFAKAAMANALGMEVNICGTRKNGKKWKRP